ncbi:MAG TPA: DUF4328 domain-containing protein [Anaeromyxobacter sp.]
MDVLRDIESERRRASVVVWLLGIVAAVNLAGVGSGLAQLALLERAASTGITTAEANANDLRHSAIAGVHVIGFLVTAVAWLFWMHRAYGNLARFGTGKTEHSPSWAVISWFIPILNLFRPYTITKELWVRSRGANAAGPAGPGAGIVGWWWTLWIINGLLGNVSNAMARSAKGIPELQSLTVVGIVGDVLTIGAAVLALVVVRRIDGYQRAAGLTARAVEALS